MVCVHVKVEKAWLNGNNILEVTLAEQLLCVGTVLSSFTYIDSFNSYNNLVTLGLLLSLFYRRGNKAKRG